ncbi:MAG: DUF4339 domain-containing protein [Planctomycetaceae bacterium]|nr:DUF4339 domain-containing protein [Planctomycetaceae bacterium]
MSQEKLWEFQKDNEVLGPYTQDRIKRAILNGEVVRSTPIRPLGATKWKRAGSVRAIYPSKKRLRPTRNNSRRALFYTGASIGFIIIGWSMYNLSFGWVLLLTFTYSLCLMPFAIQCKSDLPTFGVIGMMGCTLISGAVWGIFSAYNPPPSKFRIPDKQVTEYLVYEDTGKVVPGTFKQGFEYDRKVVTGHDVKSTLFAGVALAYLVVGAFFVIAILGFLEDDEIISFEER